MFPFRRAIALAATAATGILGLAALPAAAAGPPATGTGAVYVLSNQVEANSVLVFRRGADGTLSPAGSVDAGGAGTGGGLGSQGAVVLDEAGRHLYAVNAGSDTIASFRVTPRGLERVDVVQSGGSRPTSVTVKGGLLYVLNAGGSGSIAGFAVDGGDLEPLAGSARPLSGPATAPAQVSFTPEGSQLVVTERATQRIDLYAVHGDGSTTGPATAASAGITPFGFGFDNKGHVIVSEAFGGVPDASAVSSYDVLDGGLAPVSPSVGTTETAACWIAVTNDGRFAYAGNAGGSVSGYRVAPDGSLVLLGAEGRTAAPGASVLDLATSRNSRFLYGRLGDGRVAAWAIGADGSLAEVAGAAGLPAGAAGIAAA